jgi:hypothetical protein
MRMNKRKAHRLIFVLFLLVFSVLVLAQGIEKQEPASVQGTAGTDEPAETSPQTSDDQQQPEGDIDAGSGAAVTPIKEFKPTEQIEADSAVSFPIDI